MLLEIFSLINFPIELLIAIFIVAGRSVKRKCWSLRIGIAFLVTSLSMLELLKRFGRDSGPFGMVSFLCVVVLISLMVFYIYKMSLREAVYYSLIGYAMQHFASSTYILLCIIVVKGAPDITWLSVKTLPLYILSYTCSYGLLYLIFLRKFPKENTRKYDFLVSAEVFLLVMPIALILSFIEKEILRTNSQLAVCQIYAMIACFLVLWIQYWQRKVLRMKMEMAMQDQMISERRKQFNQSIANIDVINHKCHDLKYQIQALKTEEMSENRKKAIDELTNAVNFYDDFFRTGNEILDTVLMEKSISCRRYGITFTAMADGNKLGFMNPMDLYVMFGNALDNAIEAVREISETEKRIISVHLETKESLLILQIENTVSHTVIFEKDGNIRTTKDDPENHGFGIASIRQIVEKYDGSLALHADEQIFSLTAVFAR